MNTDLLSNNHQNSIQYEQIVFIDSTVEDYQTLIDNLVQPSDVVILDSQHDGVIQITNYLSQHNNLDAIHIVSHGDAGKLFLGNTELNQNTLSQYADILTGWNNFLKEDADILLYGCNVAADLAGTEFINKLSDYTQADILASNNITGSSQLDGDWDLEYAVGKVEAELIFNSEIETEYGSALIVLDNNLTYLNNFLDTNFPVINFNTFDFDPSSLLNFNTNYRFDNPVGNTFLFNFSASSLKFDPINFDFTSLNINSDSLTFNLNNSAFDLNSIAKNSITFEFYKTEIEKFNYNSLFSFDASSVTFTNSAVTFKYKPSSLNFNADLFKANANLFEYKFTNFDEGVSFNQFNASDYRALEYAFKGDELFDAKYYLDKKVTPIGMNPFTHYQEYGFLAGIDPNPLFDVSYYLDKNIDVRNAKMDPLKHYALFGYTENQNNRDPNALFDSSYYNEKNQDVVLAKENPLLHYIAFGNTENFDNRDPNKIFDNSYYNENNSDVANSGMTALEHYLQFGWKESLPENPKFNPNRNPNPFFKPSDYFEINDDVRLASYKLPSANPVQHMLEFGFTENRITHELFKSDNIFKVSQKVTANSEYFPLIQQQLNKSGIKLTPTSDGSIQISQASTGIGLENPFFEYIKEKVGDTLEYVFWTVLVGGGISLINKGVDAVDSGSDFVVDRLWELTVDNFLTTPSAIEFDIVNNEANNPFNTPPFEFPVSERVIEIFEPDNLIGTETIFSTPPGTVNFPTNTASPQRDAILEDLLNGGLFIGGDVTIPQGTYVVTSNRDGDLIGYNPTVLGNSLPSDWTGRINLRGELEIDLTTANSGLEINENVKIPYRTPNTTRDAQSLPREETHGLFIDHSGNKIQLRSGQIRSSLTNLTRGEILNLYSGNLRNAVNTTFDHVEGNAASIIRQLDLPRATVVINHEEGPCSFCQTGIPEILNDGQVLEVIYSPDRGITLIKDTFTGGRSFNPVTDREIGTPFF